MRLVTRVFQVFIATLLFAASVEAADSSSSGGARLYGEAAILTNYLERGITQTDANMALQAGFGYNFGNFARMGIWGSNVKFQDESANLNLRPFLAFHVGFTPNAELNFKYALSQYYGASGRNENIVGFDFVTFGYHAIIEQDSNFEGAGRERTWYGFKKQWMWGASVPFSLEGGYSIMGGTTYTNYFNINPELGYKLGDVWTSVGYSYNSSPAQFNGRGGNSVYFKVEAKF